MFTAENCLHRMYEAPYRMVDPGNAGTIWVNRQLAMIPVVSAAAETRTLAQPTKAGLVCAVVLDTDGGDVTLTVTGGWNAAADTDMTFDDAGDFAVFQSVKVGSIYYWRRIASEGIPQAYAEQIDLHALTALGAVPDAADLVAVSDESATGDPAKSTTVENFLSAIGDVTALGAAPDPADILGITDESAAGDPIRAVTVQQLFNTLGDLTDLAASPATDDRIPLTDESEAGDPAKSMTVANLFGRYFSDMTPGTGISTGTGTICEHRVSMINGIKKTEILIDLTGLNSGGTAGDIIGVDGGTANCHIGQITAAVNGTIVAGRVTCFETPAGGDPDVDIWGSVTEATGAQDAAISSLTGESQLINHADWTAGDTAILTALPAADGYLYLACGDATDADYTAGIFLIELWGV